MNSETRTRSIAKTVTYRIVIAALLALIAGAYAKAHIFGQGATTSINSNAANYKSFL